MSLAPPAPFAATRSAWCVRPNARTTMNATDPIDGFYEVEEVPWTLYYHGGYALHGAYWHTDFGKVRSHGCTNIAPVDARWLYYWSEPEVPAAWHAVRFQRETTWIQFTS
ncbi:MAG: L,D-transpeptidase [Deltaproteobacteria bacterium]|nr:L,D-transpeptidase [Deltaproteobacteria bacterium]